MMRRREISPLMLLTALPLFESLDAATLLRLADAVRRRRLARGDRLFRCGDTPGGMYVVVHGDIHLVAPRRGGGERLAGTVGAGHCFGEAVMFLERPAVVDAVAATDALVLQLPKAAVFDEIDRDPHFARRMIANLSRRIESLVGELERQSLGSGRERLVDWLLHRVERGRAEAAPAAGNGGTLVHVITLRSTKAALASQLHLTPEHFSRVLHELADEGLLRVEGRRLVVLDAQRLAQQAEAPAPHAPAARPSRRHGAARAAAPTGTGA